MNRSKLTVAEFLYLCSLRINNSLNDSAVLEAVSTYSYTAEKLGEGTVLLNSAVSLNETFDKEYADVKQAFSDKNAVKVIANNTYTKFLGVARVGFKNNEAACVALKLSGQRAYTFSGWINQVRGFYNNLLGNELWLAVMQGYGISEEILTDGLDEFKEVEDYAELIMREKGEAQQATVERDAKFEELNDWVSDYEKIATIALSDKPQLLEKLGIVVKS